MKTLTLNIACFFILFTFSATMLNAQGCIAIRNMMSCTGGNPNSLSSLTHPGQFQLTTSYRYFHSFRHFRGDHEEANRVAEGTEVINDSHSIDFGLSYTLNDRWSLSINLPVNFNRRSSLYEHYGNSEESNPEHMRFATGSAGISDLRVAATYWVLDPATHMHGNFAIGLGIKAPTGKSTVKDVFHKRTNSGADSTITKFVDQSIQLGDGGWGASIELQGYQTITPALSLYYNGFYLFNPKGVNEANLSVPDQYAGRLGVSYAALPALGLALNLGGRIEGLPAIDIFGSSEGSRRPGYIVSVEPGLLWSSGAHTFGFSVPVALYRNRIKSYSDRQDPTGQKHGDAAFADYLISANYAYRF